jgi:lipoprotein NlpI
MRPMPKRTRVFPEIQGMLLSLSKSMEARVRSVLLTAAAVLSAFVGSIGWAADLVCHQASGEAAIAACTRDIEFPGAPARYRAVAYNSRADAYRARGDIDLAIADYTEALQLESNYFHAYYNRATAFLDEKGDNERAIADLNEAIRINPGYVTAFFHRSRAYLYSGNSANALADINRAAELAPRDAYDALWADIIGQRNAVPSRLSQSMANIDMTVWPAPMIQLYLSQITPAVAFAAAEDPDPNKKKGQVCEANFYGGELALRQPGTREEGLRQLRLAATECPSGFTESFAAKAELKMLGVTP